MSENTLAAKLKAGLLGASTNIPGAEAGYAALSTGFDPEGEQQVAREQEYAKASEPTAYNIGQLSGLGALLAMPAGTAAEATGIGLKLLKSGATAAGLDALYQLGDTAHLTQLDPSFAEKADHAISYGRMLTAGVIGTAARALPSIMGGASAAANKLAEGGAELIDSKWGRAVKGALASAVGYKMGGVAGAMASPIIADMAQAARLPPAVRDAAARGVETLAGALESSHGKMEEHFSKMLNTGSVLGAQLPREDISGEYKQRVREISQAQINQEGFSTNLRAALDALPPQVADQITMRALINNQRLYEALPKNPSPPSLLQQEWEPSDTAKRKWLDRFRAADDFKYGLDHMNPEIVQFTEETHPTLVSEYRKALIDYIAENPGQPYSIMQKVGRMLGEPVRPSDNPTQGARLQQIWQQQAGEKEDPGYSSSARQQKASVNLDKAAKGWATRAQSIMQEDK